MEPNRFMKRIYVFRAEGKMKFDKLPLMWVVRAKNIKRIDFVCVVCRGRRHGGDQPTTGLIKQSFLNRRRFRFTKSFPLGGDVFDLFRVYRCSSLCEGAIVGQCLNFCESHGANRKTT